MCPNNSFVLCVSSGVLYVVLYVDKCFKCLKSTLYEFDIKSEVCSVGQATWEI